MARRATRPPGGRGPRRVGRYVRGTPSRAWVDRRSRGLVLDLGRAWVDRHPCVSPTLRRIARRRDQVGHRRLSGHASRAGSQSATCPRCDRRPRLGGASRKPAARGRCDCDVTAPRGPFGGNIRLRPTGSRHHNSALAAPARPADRWVAVSCLRQPGQRKEGDRCPRARSTAQIALRRQPRWRMIAISAQHPGRRWIRPSWPSNDHDRVGAAGPDAIAPDSGPVLSFALDWRPGRWAFACRSCHRNTFVRRGQP